MKCAGAIALVLMVGGGGACKKKHANIRILGEVDNRYVVKGAAIEVLGRKVPIYEDEKSISPLGRALVFADIPADTFPKERPIILTLHLPTPCGDFETKIPINDAEPNDQGVMNFKLPDALPMVTELHFAPGMKSTIKIGQQEIAPAKRLRLLNLECAKALSIGGVDTPMPALKNTGRSSWEVDNSVLITDQPDRCYADQVVAYGEGPKAPEEKYEKLQGSRAYALRERRYEVVFEPIPMSVKVYQGKTTTVSALTECN